MSRSIRAHRYEISVDHSSTLKNHSHYRRRLTDKPGIFLKSFDNFEQNQHRCIFNFFFQNFLDRALISYFWPKIFYKCETQISKAHSGTALYYLQVPKVLLSLSVSNNLIWQTFKSEGCKNYRCMLNKQHPRIGCDKVKQGYPFFALSGVQKAHRILKLGSKIDLFNFWLEEI